MTISAIDKCVMIDLHKIGLKVATVAQQFGVKTQAVYKVLRKVRSEVLMPDSAKEILGFKDYMIDTDGSVYSNRTAKLKMLKHKIIGNGYPGVTLTDSHGKARNLTVHRLLATTFISNPENLPVVRHLNDNKLDNRLENLAWGTHQENSGDAIINGVMPRGEKNHKSKLEEDDVRLIRDLSGIGVSRKTIAKHLGVTTGAIHSVISGKAWRQVE